MPRRWVPVIFVFAFFTAGLSLHSSFAQMPSAPTELFSTPPEQSEQFTPEVPPQDESDAVSKLTALRERIHSDPQSADNRLKLAESLYRIGDLDTAIEECRAALALQPGHAQAHLQLGMALMAKQDWRASLTALKEAARLNPELVQAHYNLGTAYYTTGNLKAAIQSYQQALALYPAFPDARYRLALVLKLARRDQESARLMEEAAAAGIPQAQFFLGNAYRTGQGVPKNGTLAVYWWAHAAEFGHQQAATSLSLLRRQALSAIQTEQSRLEAWTAFQGYREKLWDHFPEFNPRDGDTLGTMLLKQDRAGQAVSVLLQESYALSDLALNELARLYESGWEQQLPPFDKQILTCFETTAGEGFGPAKKILARIYAKGLGMKPDRLKAHSILRGLPKNEIKAILSELSLES
ncbi:MAG: tetratricopeptide repeat protein [Nitrospira sp.]|nr:tetratricopeptide repeat protein [Nitrospira sp.]